MLRFIEMMRKLDHIDEPTVSYLVTLYTEPASLLCQFLPFLT